MKRIYLFLLALSIGFGALAMQSFEPMQAINHYGHTTDTVPQKQQKVAVKVTKEPDSWTGEYLLVYEKSADSAYVFNGMNAEKNFAQLIQLNDTIQITDDVVSLTISTMTGGYSVLINGGTNDGKYINGTSGSNKLNFNSAPQLNTISYDTAQHSAHIVSNTSVMRFNTQSNLFRYYRASSYTGQQKVQLYRCEYVDSIPDVGLALWVSASNGTVTGGGRYPSMSECTLTVTPNINYHFTRWSDNNTDNPRTLILTQDTILTAICEEDAVSTTEKKLSGRFSINDSTMVRFSSGNLQYRATPGSHLTANGDTLPGVWRFAEYQNDFIGASNVCASENYAGWIDLFGWGTSGWNSGAVCYQPWSVSATSTDYTPGSATNNLTGAYANADWAMYNAISNGGNQPGLWRVMTSDEVKYLFYERPNAAKLYTLATIGKIIGVLIMPDDYTNTSLTIDQTDAATNTLTISQWKTLENNGLVFLPMAGYINRKNNTIKLNIGDYWLADASDANNAYRIIIRDNYLKANKDSEQRFYGFSVRPVRPLYNLIVQSENTNMGTVTGTEKGIDKNETRTIRATATTGYQFLQWSDGNTDNPRTVTITQNETYTAQFTRRTYNIYTQPEFTSRGTTQGDTTAYYKDSVTIAATAKYGYHFTQWSDGNTDNPRRVEVTKNITYTAQFGQNPYTIITATSDPELGTTTGDTTALYQSYITIRAIANYGYQFQQWDDGNTSNPRSVRVTEDKTYTASFERTYFRVTKQADHGSISGNTKVLYLDTASYLVTANYGYHFTAWSDGNTDNPRDIVVIGDTTIKAVFARDSFTITTQANYSERGYTQGDTTALYLDTVVLSATANYGYHFTSWGDGYSSNPRNVVVKENKTYTANFYKNTYKVSYSAENGRVTGSTSGEYLNQLTYKATANTCYHFVGWSDGCTDNPRQLTLTQDTTFAAIFESDFPMPTADELAPYFTAGQTCLAVRVVETVCNDLVFVGNYNNWDISDPAALIHLQPVTGYEDWYVAAISDTSTNVEGKIVQLTSDGTFSWEYQNGGTSAWTLIHGKATIQYNNSRESQLTNIGNAEPAVLMLAYWKAHNNPCIHVSHSKDSVLEGDSIYFTFSVAEPFDTLHSYYWSFADEHNLSNTSGTITFTKGETSHTIGIDMRDDGTARLPYWGKLRLTGERYYTPSHLADSLTIIDNDACTVELILSESEMTESATTAPKMTATIRRNTMTETAITVYLYHDQQHNWRSNSSVKFAKGDTEKTMDIYLNDDNLYQGDVQTHFAVSAFSFSSYQAIPTDHPYVGWAEVLVRDNDQPKLKMSVSSSSLLEGKTEAARITISRNTAKLDTALVVVLSTDNDEGLNYEHTVIIPAGESSVTIPVGVERDEESDDSHMVKFMVETAGFASAFTYVQVVDQTLPDAQISWVDIPNTIVVGDSLRIRVQVDNSGVVGLAKGISVRLYQDFTGKAVAQTSLPVTIPAGMSDTLGLVIPAPENVGEHRYYAIVNEEQQVKELHLNNNSSKTAKVMVDAPFTVTLNADKTICKEGDHVLITGQLTGTLVANAQVELYIINNGYRDTKTLEADATGAFTYDIVPEAGQSGHFAIGACYPSSNLKSEMISVDYYGMRLANSVSACMMTVDKPYTLTYKIKNTSSAALHNVRFDATLPNNLSAESSPIAEIPGNATVALDVILTASAPCEGNQYIAIPATITSEEGPTITPALYYYSRNAKGQLLCSDKKIQTTFSIYEPRDYSFMLRNIGEGETGEISIGLPSWMKSVSPLTIPSMASGDSTIVTVRLVYNESMTLHLPITGSIAINCTNCEGMSLPYSIEPVSDVEGVLQVDVCDEYTYYTDAHPHVENAQVLVKHPYTGAVVARGLTDEKGIFSVQLKEGYYKLAVSADNHDAYSTTLLINPSDTTRQVVNLSVEAIKITWEVVETEVEDEYKIETNITYETYVPVPEVVVDAPSEIKAYELQVGEYLIYQVKIENKGFIRADDVTIILPDGGETYSFEALAYGEPFDLDAHESVVMPVKVTRMMENDAAPVRRIHSIVECSDNMTTLYYWDCGTDRKWHQYGVPLLYGKCHSGEIPNVKPTNEGGGRPSWIDNLPSIFNFGLVGDWDGGTYEPSEHITPTEPTPRPDVGCAPCQNQVLAKVLECGISFIPFLGTAYDLTKKSLKCYNYGAQVLDNKLPLELEKILGECFGLEEPIDYVMLRVPGGNIKNGIQCLLELSKGCKHTAENAANAPSRIADESVDEPEYITQFSHVAAIAADELDYNVRFINHLIRPEIQELISSEEQNDLLAAIMLHLNELVDEDMMQSVRPAAITDELWAEFIERMNNTYRVQHGETIESTNFISEDSLNLYLQKMWEAEKAAEAMGYESTADMLNTEWPLFQNRLEAKSAAVCAKVELQISQKAVLTRQAFRGTLTVYNGHDTEAMTDMQLTLDVYNKETGVKATSHEFQINLENTLQRVGPDSTGTLNVLFIPTKYAAPESDVVYSFGGQLTYIDPYTGESLTRNLYPVDLTVSPSPNLELTYFMQRDVMGDNPLTADEVEPSEPAEFALLINNVGNGDAKNLNMLTEQPVIVENEKGMAVDFTFQYSMLNGKNKSLPLNGTIATSFGTVPAQSQAYAQWYLLCNLLGHFSEYNVSATHVSSYDNPDLSLLDTVTIHELIHTAAYPSVDPTGVAWLTNDVRDNEDMPDSCYLSDGTRATLHVGSAELSRQNDSLYYLVLTPKAEGWNYAYAADPTGGNQRIKLVTRLSDGASVDLRNVWQTTYILPDGTEQYKIPRIHVADEVDAIETYVLYFTKAEQPYVPTDYYAPYETMYERDNLPKVQKLIINQSLYILRDGKFYNAQGQWIQALK